MSDKDNSNAGLITFFQQVWGRVVGIFGVVSAILGYIKLADGNSGLFTLVLLGVGVAGLFLSCFYYAFIWKPEVNDGKPLESVIITPGSNKPVASQGKKEKRRKRIRWIARLGLLLIPVLVWGGFKYYQYQANLPPKDFKILVANFESSDSEDYLVTQKIFANLEREIEQYGDDVKVERLNKPLGSIKAAKTAGKQKKAAIVIWGDYKVMKKIVPISVNFEILKKSADLPKLGESVQGKTQPAKISELESFKLQTNLSQEMTYLSLFTLGMYRYLDDNWQQATQYYERALEVSYKTNEPVASLGKEVVYSYLGNSYYFLEVYDKALESYNQAVEINPDKDHFWNNRGSALDILGKYKDAISSFDKAIEINPDYHEALYNHGNALVELGRLDEAIASYDQAIEINPDQDKAWYNRGNALEELGKYDDAIASYDQAIEINPDYHAAWNNRGNALANLGQYEEAITSYDMAIEINPDYHAAWNNRGAALAYLGRYEETITSYDQAIEINPDNHDVWNNRGISLIRLNRYPEALTSFNKALELNPNSANALYNLACVYALQNQIPLAIENLSKAINLNSELREYAKTDSDFDAIRGDQRFKDLIENK